MSSPLVFSSLGLNNPPHITTPNILVSSDVGIGKEINEFCFAQETSSDSSSIGVDNDSSISSPDEAGEEDEVESKRKDGALSSLESIEESLPIKRGLSNYFSGKSKSFASLSDMGSTCLSSATDLAKTENPFNKRRRILMASKARRASYSSLVSTYLPPLLSPDNAVLEEGDEEEEEKRAETSADAGTADFDSLPLKNERVMGLKKAFRSPRSFSLSDLQNA